MVVIVSEVLTIDAMKNQVIYLHPVNLIEPSHRIFLVVVVVVVVVAVVVVVV